MTGVDVSPAPPTGAVVGRVTNSDGSQGLSNICVYTFSYDRDAKVLSPTVAAATCTNADGGYALHGLSTTGDANYQLAFVDPSGAYPTQWAVASRAEAVSNVYWTIPRVSPYYYLTLSSTPYTYGSIAMLAGGSISGIVTDASTNLPRAGACVYVDYSQDGTYVGQGAVTDENGRYTLTNLSPSVGFLDGGYKVGLLCRLQRRAAADRALERWRDVRSRRAGRRGSERLHHVRRQRQLLNPPPGRPASGMQQRGRHVGDGLVAAHPSHLSRGIPHSLEMRR